MKIITLQKIGYNAPAAANWCYDIYTVSLIDTKRYTAVSYTVASAFGELTSELKKHDIQYIELTSVCVRDSKGWCAGTQKLTGVRGMDSIEKVIREVREFTKKPMKKYKLNRYA